MFLKVISDIHIHEDNIIPSDLYDPSKTKDTILLVAGDICSPYNKLYAQILTKFSKDFEKVFVVAGNREYYNVKTSNHGSDYADVSVEKSMMTEYSMANIDDKINSICKSLDNCVYLNNNSFEYKGILFYGGTLWFDIDRVREPLMNEQINKLDLIRVNGKMSTFEDMRKFNREFVNNFSTIIENNKNGKPVIVISHFPPDLKSSVDKDFLETDKYIYKDFFQNDLSHLFYSSVEYWFYGHTHLSQSKIINGTVLVSNPYKNLSGCYSPTLEYFYDHKK